MQIQSNLKRNPKIGPLILAFGLFSKKKPQEDVLETLPAVSEVVIDKDHDHFDLIEKEPYDAQNSGLNCLQVRLGAQTISFRMSVVDTIVEINKMEIDGKKTQLVMADGLQNRRMFKNREFFLYAIRPPEKMSHYSFRIRIHYRNDVNISKCQDLYFRKKDDHFEHYLSHPIIRA
jgi:hypothetical protein